MKPPVSGKKYLLYASVKKNRKDLKNAVLQ